MKKCAKKTEYGMVVVEASVILPLVVLCVFLFIYTSMMLMEKALLQASLETALVYYRSELTDTFIEKNSAIKYSVKTENETDTTKGSGNKYVNNNEPLSPYRGMLGNKKKFNQEDFKKYFLSAGTFVFDSNIDVTIGYTNYVVFEELVATASQKIPLPIDFSNLGIGKEYTINATARVVATDHDNMIDNIDFVIHLVNKTKLGDMIKNIGSKVGEIYGKIRGTLGAE